LNKNIRAVDNSLLEGLRPALAGQRPATCLRDPEISSNERTLCDRQDRTGSRELVFQLVLSFFDNLCIGFSNLNLVKKVIQLEQSTRFSLEP
jgi:hypothetical protein